MKDAFTPPHGDAAYQLPSPAGIELLPNIRGDLGIGASSRYLYNSTRFLLRLACVGISKVQVGRWPDWIEGTACSSQRAGIRKLPRRYRRNDVVARLRHGRVEWNACVNFG